MNPNPMSICVQRNVFLLLSVTGLRLNSPLTSLPVAKLIPLWSWSGANLAWWGRHFLKYDVSERCHVGQGRHFLRYDLSEGRHVGRVRHFLRHDLTQGRQVASSWERQYCNSGGQCFRGPLEWFQGAPGESIEGRTCPLRLSPWIRLCVPVIFLWFPARKCLCPAFSCILPFSLGWDRLYFLPAMRKKCMITEGRLCCNQAYRAHSSVTLFLFYLITSFTLPLLLLGSYFFLLLFCPGSFTWRQHAHASSAVVIPPGCIPSLIWPTLPITVSFKNLHCVVLIMMTLQKPRYL